MTDSARLRFGIVTGRDPAGLSRDGELLAGELRDRGHTAEPVVWTADDPGPGSFDALVLRSCWAYHEQPDRFRDWLDAASDAGLAVLNPLDAVRWNVHKSYLRDLAETGVDVVPTEWVPASSDADLRSVLAANGWERAVVKPAIGTSSTGVWRTSLEAAPSEQSRFDATLAEGDALVQQFAPEIADGELSFVFLGGQYSHATKCFPADDEFRSHPSFGGTVRPYAPAGLTREAARDVLLEASDLLGIPLDRLPYARVDGLRRNGTFELMELELIEPYLGLERASGAASRFADAVLSALGSERRSARSTPNREQRSGEPTTPGDQRPHHRR